MRATRFKRWFSVLALPLCSACAEPDAPVAEIVEDVTVADVVIDNGLPPGAICEPGSVKACLVEGGKEALICNETGTGWIEGVCKGVDGLDSQCVAGACSACYPGVLGCVGDTTVARCADDGSEYVTEYECEGGVSGQVCLNGQCQSLCELNFKFNSYIGCDYWGVDLDNAFVPGGTEVDYYDALNAQYAIVVANPPDAPVPAAVEIWHWKDGEERQVTHDSDGTPLTDEPLEPGDLRVYKLGGGDFNVNGTTLAKLAYRVTSSSPIIAYQFNPLENENVFSNDASLLLPANLLGPDYIVMTREQTFEILRGFLTVVAVLPGETEVVVQVSAHTEPGILNPGTDEQRELEHLEPGDTRIFKLQQYDVLNIETDRPGADLTGSQVRANRRIAVFGGSEAANAPNTARCVSIDPVTGMGHCVWDSSRSCEDLMDCVAAGFNTCCADHLEQQLFPVSVWGSEYIATKSWDRNLESDIWRILAAEDNTRVMLTPPQQGVSIPTLNRGEWFEFESRNNFEIRAIDDKPILVGQFLAAQDAPDPNIGGISTEMDAGIGDPAFILAIPIQQYRTDYVILAPNEYEDNYISVVTLTGAEVSLDGLPLENALFEPIASGQYSVYRQRIEPGTHTLTSSSPTSIIVYGYDRYVSYGYTGGLNLTELNSGIGLLPADNP